MYDTLRCEYEILPSHQKFLFQTKSFTQIGSEYRISQQGVLYVTHFKVVKRSDKEIDVAKRRQIGTGINWLSEFKTVKSPEIMIDYTGHVKFYHALSEFEENLDDEDDTYWVCYEAEFVKGKIFQINYVLDK